MIHDPEARAALISALSSSDDDSDASGSSDYFPSNAYSKNNTKSGPTSRGHDKDNSKAVGTKAQKKGSDFTF